MKVIIEQVKTFSLGLTQELNSLLIQLNPDSRTLLDEDVKETIEESSNHLLVAKEPVNHKIVGMLTLIINRIPSWKKGWIEDVVVDKKYRNQGIATELITYAIENAKNNGAVSLNLTSRPEREDANKLYGKLGFKKRDTNVYRMEL
ncbi:MAG: hypothetical protein A3B47_00110 [Candidatus Levybacteria bacterium RIFCSPLOWO2_01_FULL_39_24]|nr:MAG: hypothetical protein A2800_01080 [Candidatus Levybacteria bacterium RIFCSPHIGHO2_01_FULL_40_16]OGH28334.1 MAG: hypothetical protein A3E12_01375 [Candidatus Levybacteria bacterium RIFCSPHIGHO2_12_FULL_39_9]OGH46180.1 MAG: hypothetical protein A3B47_00110 [Candidatus Levybacteria bacterium RIFCSPLOWO2_01_FULL_39_24]